MINFASPAGIGVGTLFILGLSIRPRSPDIPAIRRRAPGRTIAYDLMWPYAIEVVTCTASPRVVPAHAGTHNPWRL